MECNFVVGQKVVLAIPYEDHIHFRALIAGDTLPVENTVYTVKEIEPADEDGYVFIRLCEISNPIPDDKEREAAFNAARFRPLVERKTDISIFKAMLNPSKVRETANV